MDNKDSITEINLYGETTINLSPEYWGKLGMETTAIVDNAKMIVKNYQGKPISELCFKKNSKVTLVKDGHNSRAVWNAEDVISSTL